VKTDILPSVMHQGLCPRNASPQIQEICWILTSLMILYLMALYCQVITRALNGRTA